MSVRTVEVGPSSFRIRRMGMWLLIIAGVYLLYLLAGCAVQRTVLFPRHVIGEVGGADEAAAAVEAAAGEQWWLETEAGKVEAWFFPGDGVSAEAPGPAVIFAHGNAEVIDFLPEQIEPYRRLGISVLLGEYRGYGRSAGKPSQQAIVSDFVAMHDRLAEREEVDVERIVLHGRSVGTGVICGLAAEREPAVVILQSPFTSVASIMASYGIPRFCVLDPFDNAAVLAELDRPVLLQHGRRDGVIAHHHSETLRDIAREATLISYDAGHNDFPIFTADYWEDVTRFLASYGIIAESRDSAAFPP